MSDLLRTSVDAYLSKALPRWLQASTPETGLYVEGLEFGGGRTPTNQQRARVQGRQLYVQGLAQWRGHLLADQTEIPTMHRRWQDIRHHYQAPDGGYHTLLDVHAQVLDETRTLYDQAFFLMGLAWLDRCSGLETYRHQAEELWQFIESLRDTTHSAFLNGVPSGDEPRQQNPHMHLFEACLLWLEVDPGETWRARADELFDLFRKRFFVVQAGHPGYLAEFFTPHWTPHPETGNHIDPGHHFEWVWLLCQYRQLTGLDTPLPYIEQLYARGLEWGVDQDGLAFDEILPGGEPLRPTKRLWVQCESLKGHLAYARLHDDGAVYQRARQVLDRIVQLYLILPEGTWFDQLSRDRRNLSHWSPASTLYHLYVALDAFLQVNEPKLRSASHHMPRSLSPFPRRNYEQ